VWIRAAAVALASVLVLLVGGAPAGATGTEQIEGSGSSWAFNAVSAWVSDVTQQGLQVVFTPSGSATGRQDYANGVTDFAVSDIGYQGQNPETGQNDISNRHYAYLPIVGGATTFPYNLTVAGQQVQNLRLSGLTLAKIFTDQITNWDDPEITADNNGRQLPSIPIIPVVHSEGAGSTYQFTDFLYTEYPALWKDFSSYNFPVEFWPTGKGSQVAENGSDGVMNFVASAAGAGSIGFDEYSYALGAGYPVAAIENTAGYFTMPDAYDAAVALTQAQINTDPNPADCSNLGFNTSPCYLLEKLGSVYTYNDPRTYPLSSYSYEILPTEPSCSGPATSCEPTMNTAKRQTLAKFDTFSLCQGQDQMAAIGYSPLPVNLVEASFSQVQLLKTADPQVDVSNVNVATCNNPTFIAGHPSENYLAQIAPYPPACAKSGAGPCAGQYAHNGNPVNGRPPTVTISVKNPVSGSTSGGGGSSSAGGGSSAAAGGGSAAAANGGSAAAASGGSAAAVPSSSAPVHTASNSANGSSGSGSNGSGGNSASTNTPPVDVATVLSSAHSTGVGDLLIQILAAALIVGAVAMPEILRRTRRSRGAR
jgi:ABC-type phosphate transport system substrate-binding protein